MGLEGSESSGLSCCGENEYLGSRAGLADLGQTGPPPVLVKLTDSGLEGGLRLGSEPAVFPELRHRAALPIWPPRGQAPTALALPPRRHARWPQRRTGHRRRAAEGPASGRSACTAGCAASPRGASRVQDPSRTHWPMRGYGRCRQAAGAAPECASTRVVTAAENTVLHKVGGARFPPAHSGL